MRYRDPLPAPPLTSRGGCGDAIVAFDTIIAVTTPERTVPASQVALPARRQCRQHIVRVSTHALHAPPHAVHPGVVTSQR